MNKLKFFIFIFIFLFYNQGFSQILTLKRTINWKANQVFYDEKNTDLLNNPRYLLSFENAGYNAEHQYLPVYMELLPATNANYEVSIKNLIFETINTEDLKNVSGINAIPSDLSIESKVRTSRKKSFLCLSFIPMRKNKATGAIERLKNFEIQLIEKSQPIKKILNAKDYHANSILSTGKWIKIKINKSGVYKISFNQLRDLGIENPQNARIFGNGGKMLPYYNNESVHDDLTENKIWIKNENIYFYGEGPVEWKYDGGTKFFSHQKHLYSDYSYYFISSDCNSQTNNMIQTEEQSENPATHEITTFTDYAFHETDSINLIKSGQLWVGENFDYNTAYYFTFNFPNLKNLSPIVLETSLLARSPISSSFTIDISGQTFNTTLGPVSYSDNSRYAIQRKNKFNTTATSGKIDVKLTYKKSTASSEGWIDYITINAIRELTMNNEQLPFRNTESVGIGNIGNFVISQANAQIQVWDITNKQEPRKINATLNGSTLSFKVQTDSLREFVAFEESMAYSPIITGNDVGTVENQNLHGITQADMVIVCNPDFYQHAIELQQIHQENDNLSVVVVKNQQVYNEFSSGAPDVSAVKNFMRILYDRAGGPDDMPKYLCLFGDGSYDNRPNSGQNTNYILTYQSENSLDPTNSFVTDDFYGFLDPEEDEFDGLLDIGIGRIPVKTQTEASEAITKIKNYLSIQSHGDWRNRICFIADDEDGNSHMSQADELSTIIKNNFPVFNIEKIYLDAFEQQSTSSGQRYPDVNLSIDNSIAKGLLLVNYTGHANENHLALENILSVDQINKYENSFKLPVFITATCEFSRFDDYEYTSAGEQLFLNPRGAAIALFSTTRLVYGPQNFDLNSNIYQYIFGKDINTGFEFSLGDIMRHSKNVTFSGMNKLNFILLGDPALKLSYAQLNVKTNRINQSPANTVTDTLRAFQKVTVQGEIQDNKGTKLSSYNGLVYPVVFDKKQEVKTLNNDGFGSFTYSVINSQIFKGKASVNNGDFQFSFIVPKDIRYNLDTGKISYYSTNLKPLEDAKGSYKNFLIGGIADTNTLDKEGPEIKIYLNDENFVNGGLSGKNPKLLVHLSDSGGINTTGSSIGHDIIATIDNNSNLKFILNDFYESETDDYSSGKVNYNLPELESGEHTLHLKVWDVYNNSSEDSIVFNVEATDNLEISHVLNYPNPFSTRTSFYFEHNRPNEILEVLIHVFTVSGKIIKTIRQEVLTDGFRSPGIFWDGRDDFGNKPGRGVYFYKISVNTLKGESVAKLEKLLMLN